MPAATVPVDKAVREIVQGILEVGERPQLLGRTELEIRQRINELACLLEGAVLARQAERTEANCPDCGQRLSDVRQRERAVRTVHGEIRVRRGYGYCRGCDHWVAPADRVWGIEADKGELSPLLREITAWMATVAPVELAAQTVEKALGIEVGHSHVEREAKRAGARAVALRHEQTRKALDLEERKHVIREARKKRRGDRSVLVVMVDGWMISERWEWREVKAATVFRLDQRGKSGKRPIITEREYIATRGVPEAISEMIWAAALRHGLLQAREVLFIADGAVWIWNLQRDRFPEARGILDFPHGTEHLWAVARELYGEGTDEARRWVEPLIHQLRHGEELPVLQTMRDLIAVVRDTKVRAVVERETRYLESRRDHIQYAAYERAGYPLGSGAMESTCKQFQVRFKRAGQFWTEPGDEKILCLCAYRMSDRWQELWPHLEAA